MPVTSSDLSPYFARARNRALRLLPARGSERFDTPGIRPSLLARKTARFAPVLDALAQSQLHALLAQLKRGQLSLEYAGKTATFGGQGEPRAHVTIHNAAVYREILLGGSIGAGESYIAGDWSTPDLLEVMRLMAANLPLLTQMDAERALLRKAASWLSHRGNANTKRGSARNIAAHYDLGNDFFRLMLDERMMYSSAIFPSSGASLEEASVHKLETLCRKLRLGPRDHLLEIGTGWGSMALYAAEHYGCRVTTTTLSRAQYDYARAQIERAGLQEQIALLQMDYRDLTGVYDKIVSIEMVEAVGHAYYADYFDKCSRLLKPDGLMALQAITLPDQRYEAAKRSVDFIQAYIFPGSSLPSNAILAQNISEHTDMQIVHLEDITQHYARTLSAWRTRFSRSLHAIRNQGFSEAFLRMWDFYLCYCEGGFRERAISAAQFVIAKPEARF